jgi:hypothetical protein
MIQGRRDEALALLEEIRHEFDGQIVTPDIAAADKLLASLRSSSQG